MTNKEKAAAIVRAIRGCGIPKSLEIVEGLSAEVIDEIISVDEAGNRKLVHGILNGSELPPAIEGKAVVDNTEETAE